MSFEPTPVGRQRAERSGARGQAAEGGTAPVGRERTGDAWTLVFTRELRHPRTTVWAALTDPDHLAAWSPFRPDRDLGRTGPATFAMEDGDTKANIVRAEPPHTLEYQWDEDLLRWNLEELEGGGTRLTLRHTTQADGFLPRLAAGWHICLDVADRLLAGDPVPVIRGEEAKKHGWQELADAYAAKLGPEEDA